MALEWLKKLFGSGAAKPAEEKPAAESQEQPAPQTPPEQPQEESQPSAGGEEETWKQQ